MIFYILRINGQCNKEKLQYPTLNTDSYTVGYAERFCETQVRR